MADRRENNPSRSISWNTQDAGGHVMPSYTPEGLSPTRLAQIENAYGRNNPNVRAAANEAKYQRDVKAARANTAASAPVKIDSSKTMMGKPIK